METNQAINVLIQAVQLGQSAGAYSIEDSYKIYLAIKHLTKNDYERNEDKERTKNSEKKS